MNSGNRPALLPLLALPLLALPSLALCITLFLAVPAAAQSPDVPQDAALAHAPHAHPPRAHSFDDLNYLAGDAGIPALSDSFLGTHDAFRQSMFRHGTALRLITQQVYTQNTLAAPVTPDSQVYVGQYPFGNSNSVAIFTSDLRQLHLHNAQFFLGGVWNWVSWNPAGPRSIQFWDFYLYKAFANQRLQVKAGYMSFNLEFVGLYVGGSTASGGQGVYAVLPYEVGMSYFPLTAPAFLFRLSGPHHSYLKFAAQRSLDPAGGPAEVARNHIGLRFDPHGDKLLAINEVGYLRSATASSPEMWFRAGYLHNSTAYRNVVTGQPHPGNSSAYFLLDRQLHQSDPDHPDHGLYAGLSYVTVPSALNDYTRYYEARAYLEAPFRSRPTDMLSFVASHTDYSAPLTDHLVAQGKAVWRAGSAFTASYSIHTSPGSYLNFGASYLYGPAITPRVSNALNAIAAWTLYF